MFIANSLLHFTSLVFRFAVVSDSKSVGILVYKASDV